MSAAARIALPTRPTTNLAGVSAVYAAGAAPLFFIYTLLPALLRRAGVPAEWVGLIFLAYLPYASRFLWAPLIDGRAASIRRYLGWTAATLPAGIAMPGLLLTLDPASDLGAIILLSAAAVALLVTAQTAIDGYLVACTGEAGRARAATFQGAGAALGGLLLGALTWLLDLADWRASILLLVAVSTALAAPALLLARAEVSGVAAPVASSSGMTPLPGWREFLARGDVRRLMLVSALAHGGLGLVMGYLPALQVGSGLSLAEIGLIGMVGANLVGLAGAGIAGLLVARLGIAAALAIIAAAAGLVALVWASGRVPGTPAQGIALLSFLVMGLGFAFFVAFRGAVLGLCRPGRAATEAAILFSFDAVFSILTSVLAGLLAGGLGISGLFLLSAAFCVLGAIIALRSSPGWPSSTTDSEPGPA